MELFLTHPSFNFIDAFKYFDVKKQGFILQEDLASRLSELKLKLEDSELSLLFRRLDIERSGEVKYSDFCKELAPLTEEQSEELLQRVPPSKALQKKFKKHLLQILKVYFQTLLEVELRLEEILRVDFVGVDLDEAWRLIATEGKPEVDHT